MLSFNAYSVPDLILPAFVFENPIESAILSAVLKPTPSIFKTQDTINVKTKENTTLTLEGRHDSCIVPRAAAAIEAATAMVIYDIIS